MALPLLEVKDEISEVGIMLDDGIKGMDSKLDSIAKTLQAVFSVDKDVKKKLEGILELRQEELDRERQQAGLELEAERESKDKTGNGIQSRIEKAGDNLANNTSFLGSMALAAGSALVLFKDSVDDFLGKFGVSTKELDNIVYGLAAVKGAIPKTTPSKISTAKPAAKPAPKFGPLKSATATPAAAALRNTGLDKLKSSRITAAGKTIPKASTDALKTGATATAKAADTIGGSIAKSASKVVSKAAGIAAPLVAGVNVASTELDPSLTRSEKNIEHSGTAGGLGGALAGAKLGAMGYAAGPVVGTITTIAGGIAGSLLGEELGTWLGKMGFGEDEKAETMADKVGGAELQQTISDEDRAMNAGPVRAASETQMYGMNVQGFNAAAKSRSQIAAESLNKIQNVKPTISGDNVNVTVKVDKASKETVDPARVQPIIRQGDTINNITNNNMGGGSSAGRSVPPAVKTNKSSGTTGSTELTDFVHGSM